MKTYTSKNEQSFENQSVWEAFTAYLSSIYFEGAENELDPDLVEFEYEWFLGAYC